MASETGNTKARKEQRGSSEDNIARDRDGRKGGSNEKNL